MPRLGLYANPNAIRPPAEPPSLAVGTLERRTASLSCGEATYLRHGSGPPLLLVHGIPTSARLWEPLLGDLGASYDCIAVDLLGMGRSRPAPGADLSSPGQAAMLDELLEHLGLDRVVVVAHDQGGAHVLQFVDRYPERLTAVAFCDVVCFDNWLVPAIAVMDALCRSPLALGVLGRARLAEQPLLRAWPFPQTTTRAPLPKAMTDDWLHAIRSGPGPQLDAFCAYVRAQSPRWTAETERICAGVAVPAHVVWAADDRFLPVSWATRLAAALPTADDAPSLLPFAGHFWQGEVPRTGARVLGDWLARVT